VKLVREKDGAEVKVGDELATFRGEACKLVAVQEPHKPGSTGRIYVEFGTGGRSWGYFPSVCGLKWVKE